MTSLRIADYARKSSHALRGWRRLAHMHSGAEPTRSAAILALGTAVPPQCVEQADYPDFLLGGGSNSVGEKEPMKETEDLKKKFTQICQGAGVTRRYLTVSKEVLRRLPVGGPSLNGREEIMKREVPLLAAKAAMKAIEDWGRPKSEITHVVMAATGGVSCPGADASLVQILDLAPDTQRVMLYQLACSAGGTALRVGKNFAENNPGSRVLVVTSEVTLAHFQPPSQAKKDALVQSALFGDGAAALVLGTDPRPGMERPLYDLHWAGQRLIPGSAYAVTGNTTEAGFVYRLDKDLPNLVERNVKDFMTGVVTAAGMNHVMNAARHRHFADVSSRSYHKLAEEFAILQLAMASGANWGPQYARQMHTQPRPDPQGSDLTWNDMFWIMHPGGPAIIDGVERGLQLSASKLECTRWMLANYGNLASSSIFFVMDRMLKLSKEQGKSTTGLGSDWGAIMAFGPGITIEATILKSCPL